MTPPLPPTSPPEGDEPVRPSTGGQGRGRSRKRAVEGFSQTRRLSKRAAVAAVLAHVAILAIVVPVLTFGHGMPAWLSFADRERPTEERLTYVTPQQRPTPTPKPVVTPPVTPSVTSPRATRPMSVAEPQVPAGVPNAPTPIAPRDTGSGGNLGNGVGALDPNVRGVRPGYTDERVWRGEVGNGGNGGGGSARRGDRAENLDSIMAGALMAAGDSLDSLARAQGKYGRKPGDWTKTGKNGEKWGWDERGIRLGKFTIPNALLGLLPLNAATAAGMSGNPTAMEAGRRTAAASADIQRMSARGMGDAEFKKIVKEMDARRDTYRRERLRSPSASVAAPLKGDGKTTTSGQPSGR